MGGEGKSEGRGGGRGGEGKREGREGERGGEEWIEGRGEEVRYSWLITNVSRMGWVRLGWMG